MGGGEVGPEGGDVPEDLLEPELEGLVRDEEEVLAGLRPPRRLAQQLLSAQQHRQLPLSPLSHG